MLGLTLDTIVNLLGHYGIVLLFPIAVIEGPVITILAGFVSSLGFLNPAAAYVTVVAADIAGDSIYYALGRWSRNGIVARFGRHFGLNNERVKKLESYYAKYHWKVLFVGKTQAIGSPVLISAGIAKMPFGKFVLYNTLATMPKSLLFLVIGYFFGKSYNALNEYLNYAAAISFLILALSIGGYAAWRRSRANKQRELTL